MVFSLGIAVSGLLFLVSLLIRKTLIKLIFFKLLFSSLSAYPFRFVIEKILKWSVGTGLKVLEITHGLP